MAGVINIVSRSGGGPKRVGNFAPGGRPRFVPRRGWHWRWQRSRQLQRQRVAREHRRRRPRTQPLSKHQRARIREVQLDARSRRDGQNMGQHRQTHKYRKPDIHARCSGQYPLNGEGAGDRAFDRSIGAVRAGFAHHGRERHLHSKSNRPRQQPAVIVRERNGHVPAGRFSGANVPRRLSGRRYPARLSGWTRGTRPVRPVLPRGRVTSTVAPTPFRRGSTSASARIVS